MKTSSKLALTTSGVPNPPNPVPSLGLLVTPSLRPKFEHMTKPDNKPYFIAHSVSVYCVWGNISAGLEACNLLSAAVRAAAVLCTLP